MTNLPPIVQLSDTDRGLLQSSLLLDPLVYASLLARTANVQHIISTLITSLQHAVINSSTSTTPTVVRAVATPPVGKVGLLLTQYARTGIDGVTFTGVKDGNVIITAKSPRGEVLPIPDPWRPFRDSYVMQFSNASPINSTGSSTTVARADIVYIPSAVWNAIERELSTAMGYLSSRVGFDGSGVAV